MPKTMNGAAEVLLVTGDPQLDGETIDGIVCLTVRYPDDRVKAIVEIANTLQAGGIAFLMAMLGNGIDGEVYAREITQRIHFDRIGQGTATDPRSRLVIVQGPDGHSTGLEEHLPHIKLPHLQLVKDDQLHQSRLLASASADSPLGIIREEIKRIKSATALPPEL